ncbi:MAG: GNAT family N-acetyltransferase [Anaerolineaceae bacterium]|nr:GNAT family N-acetyltransferase [Anaerolineaceae bacterium]MBN2676753.1 GNAT family N-acetyltransferase [Anaerolineaceae bacterium]
MDLVIPHSDGYSIRQADWKDAIPIQHLLSYQSKIHRFLDWRDPLQWLGMQPFMMLEKQGKLHAVLACPIDPLNIAWVRLFACSWEIDVNHAWDLLTAEVFPQLTIMNPDAHCYLLALEGWIDHLAQQKQYPKHQEIVILQRDLSSFLQNPVKIDIIIRKITQDDLPRVASIDTECFEDLWIYSQPTLQLAYQKSDITYLAEMHSKPVGYLLGTISDDIGHLARIAVLPEVKRHQIATSLIGRFMLDLEERGLSQATVNTQSNNQASLALYDKMGFQRTGESFGVYRIL